MPTNFDSESLTSGRTWCCSPNALLRPPLGMITCQPRLVWLYAPVSNQVYMGCEVAVTPIFSIFGSKKSLNQFAPEQHL
ncbi:hypothetical protein CY34DRAFT_336096 [Suillus luteus UH-Slu-Lm8-n1]|uniref:Uncharacterized protein n=1 Tax=Suillus luteus UH-Slu-Lm8-n1 TaxID=930992 RepID=A0A0C9ZP84_9AGAM|nr:hypothetical protein CY34DRAFT_336096 [Suillus luteus UH-Slu-Lm8-n1]